MAKARTEKDQKRSTAAARTVERRQERERERRRQRLIAIVILIIAIILIVSVPLLLANQPSEAPIPETALTRYAGISSSRTNEGYLRLGDPDSPVQVAEYSSFGCTTCKTFEDAILNPMIERVRADSIAFIYVPLWQRTGGLANTQGAARAAVCAGEQNRFWPLHDAFFDWQTRYGNQAYTNSRILSGVTELGMNRTTYDSCINSGRPDDVLSRAQQQANSLINFEEMPAITINGVVPVNGQGSRLTEPIAIVAAVDNAIATSTRRQQTPTVEATEAATPEAEASVEAEGALMPDIENTPEATGEANE
jgi:protein-disulfide isomerase